MAASTRCRIWPGPQTTLRESLDKYLKDLEFWSGQLDSNQRPAVPKTAALPGCAIPRFIQGNRVDTRFRHVQQGWPAPSHRPLNRGWPTRSPGSMPYFFAVPAITSSTPFANPRDGMIRVDIGSV